MIKNIFLKITLFSIVLFASNCLNANIVVINGLSHIHNVTPGSIAKGRIELQNTKDSEQTVKIYQRDYFFYFTGETQYNEPGSQKRSNVDWININPQLFTLKPLEKAVVYYEIKVPEVDTLIGSYWSVIMVEGMRPMTEDISDEGFKISTLVRYAIQIVANINPGAKKDVEFLNVNLKKNNGVKIFEVDLQNIGELLLQPEISLEMFNDSGKSTGKYFSEKKKLYPGTSARFFIEIKDQKQGIYKAVLIADCQNEDVFGVNLTVELKDDQ